MRWPQWWKTIVMLALAACVAGLGLLAWPVEATRLDESQVPSEQSGEGNWWAWLFQPETDQVFLVNDDGEQASLARPRLDDERDGGTARLSISRDGQYLLVVAPLNTGQTGVAMYDFASGDFLWRNEVPASEIVHPGGPLSFSADNRQVALGFANSSGEWRVAVYEVASGLQQQAVASTAATSRINGVTDLALMTALASDRSYLPRIVYLDGSTVHFQLVPAGNEGLPAYGAIAWDSATNTMRQSAYTAAEIDINPASGEALFAYTDPAFAALEPEGSFPSYNAIGEGGLPDAGILWVDGTHWHFSPEWAADGELVLFRAADASGEHWAMLRAGGDEKHRLDGGIVQVAGLSEGYLALYADGRLNFQPAGTGSSSTAWTGPAGELEFLWTSLPGSETALITVAVPQPTPQVAATFTSMPAATALPAANPTPTTPPNVVWCPGSPASQLVIGIRGRVTYTDGTPTRLRQSPGGEILYNMPEGTPFNVVGGPQCEDDYTWWRIQLDDGQVGWSAEGDDEDYFLEPMPGGGREAPVSSSDGSVEGFVWHDLCDASQPGIPAGCVANSTGGVIANGLREADEEGIVGVEVSLGRGGCPSTGLSTFITRADGGYAFRALSPGNYCVSVNAVTAQNAGILVPGEWSSPRTFGSTAGVTLTIGSGDTFLDINFGWDYQFAP